MIMCSFHMPKFNLVEREKRVLERERERGQGGMSADDEDVTKTSSARTCLA